MPMPPPGATAPLRRAGGLAHGAAQRSVVHTGASGAASRRSRCVHRAFAAATACMPAAGWATAAVGSAQTQVVNRAGARIAWTARGRVGESRRWAGTCHAAGKRGAGAGSGGARTTLYDVLGVTPTSSAAEIKTAFRRLALRLHPDVSDDPDATQRFTEVKAAYETLSCDKARRDYDATLRTTYSSSSFTSYSWGPAAGSSGSRDGYRRAGRAARPGAGIRWEEQGGWGDDDESDGDGPDDYSAGGFYRWAESGSHQTSWKANRKKQRARNPQQQQQQQAAGDPQASAGKRGAARGTGQRRAGGRGGPAGAGGSRGGAAGDLEALLSQLDDATLRGLRSVYGPGLQGLQDAEELIEFLEQVESLRRSGVEFRHFGDGTSSSSSSSNAGTTSRSRGRRGADAFGSSNDGSARRAQQQRRRQQQQQSRMATYIDIDNWLLSGGDLADIADLLGLEDVGDLLAAFEDEEASDDEMPRGSRTSAGARASAASDVRNGGGSGSSGEEEEEEEDGWLWEEEEEEEEDGPDGWYQRARREYGDIG